MGSAKQQVFLLCYLFFLDPWLWYLSQSWRKSHQSANRCNIFAPSADFAAGSLECRLQVCGLQKILETRFMIRTLNAN